MKNIKDIFEGMFDADFDALNIPTQPIDINIPICKGGDNFYAKNVKDCNAAIAVLSHLGDINRAFKVFNDITDDIKKSKGNINAACRLTGIDKNILNSWDQLDVTKSPLKETLKVISSVQKYNDAIGIINKMSCAKLLKDADFWCWFDPDDFNETYISWNIKKDLTEIYDELERVVPKIKIPGLKVTINYVPNKFVELSLKES